MSAFPPGTRVLGDEVVYRRVPKAPSFTAVDYETKSVVLTPAALQFDPDGVSLHREAVLKAISKSIDEIYDFSEVGAVSFSVEIADGVDGRVWYTPIDGEGLAGEAHASLTGATSFRPSKSERSRISEAIREAASWVQLPPAA